MLRRITSLITAAIMLLLCFGCSDKTDDGSVTEKAIAPEKKIALIIGSEKQDGDAFAMAKALKLQYGDNLLVHSYSDNYLNDSLSLTTIATELANDTTVKAIVFGNGVESTAHAAQRVRELRSDMCIIICNPVEEISDLAQNSNLILRLDYKSIADSMVRNAAEMGAETFVFYTFQRHADYSYVKEMREIAGKVCGELKIEYEETFSVDPYVKGSSEEIAKTFVGEDFYRKTKEFGENIAVYSTDPFIQEELIRLAAQKKYIVAGTATLSPFSFANALKVDVKGHETDSKYVLAAVTNKLSKTESKGRMASWNFSAPMMTLRAGFDYAYFLLYAGAGWANNLDALNNIIGEIAGETPFTVKRYSEGNEKTFLLGSDFYTY